VGIFVVRLVAPIQEMGTKPKHNNSFTKITVKILLYLRNYIQGTLHRDKLFPSQAFDSHVAINNMTGAQPLTFEISLPYNENSHYNGFLVVYQKFTSQKK